MPKSNIKFIPIQNRSVIVHVCFVLFIVCLYICVREFLLQNNKHKTKNKNNTNCLRARPKIKNTKLNKRTHTHTNTPTQSRWTPGPSPETIQPLWSPCAFTGMHLQSHRAPCAFTGMHPQTNPQSKFPPQPFPPIPGSMFYVVYLTRDSTARCVLARCGVQSSRIFVALWPTCVVLSRYVSSPVAFHRLPLSARRGPRGLPSPTIFMFLGGMKGAFKPLPGTLACVVR